MASTPRDPVRTGADMLLAETEELIDGKTIGILTNHTGRLSDGRHLIDAIAASGRAHIAALFSPEHGISGSSPDGVAVNDSPHEAYSVPIYSLYGETQKPTSSMLSGLDVLVCDIQDIGARFYTYASTVALAMEAAAEHGVSVIVLDRPNPIRGLDYDGPIRAETLKSFVGWMPTPVTHGMTVGEMAQMWNGERWLAGGLQASLRVVGLKNWHRGQWYDQTGLAWIPPSPNMPRLETAILYPGMCLVEGTNLSEGRGTTFPFEISGAPWVSPEQVLTKADELPHEGVRFEETSFVPHTIAGVAHKPRYDGQMCRGIRVSVINRDRIRPVLLGVTVLAAFLRAHPEQMHLVHPRFDFLSGDVSVGLLLEAGAHPEEIVTRWKAGLARFGDVREHYLLYT